MKQQKVFLLNHTKGQEIVDLQNLLDDGWSVVLATPKSVSSTNPGVYYGSIVYILEK